MMCSERLRGKSFSLPGVMGSPQPNQTLTPTTSKQRETTVEMQREARWLVCPQA